jgi:hypothetical protein
MPDASSCAAVEGALPDQFQVERWSSNEEMAGRIRIRRELLQRDRLRRTAQPVATTGYLPHGSSE